MTLTLHQFMRLGGEKWGHSFLIRVGKRASELHRDIFGTAPKKVRTKRNYRNKVGVYPCGILEQAFRQVKEETLEQAETTPDEPTLLGTP